MTTSLPSYRATNGFLAVCTTYGAFFVYLLWALLPRSWTTRGFLAWLPDKAWATIVPSYLMTVVLLTYLAYLGLMAYNTPSLDSLTLLIDSRGEIPAHHFKGRYHQQIMTLGTPVSSVSSPTRHAPDGTGTSSGARNDEDGPYDVPLSIINAQRFPPRRRPRPERHTPLE